MKRDLLFQQHIRCKLHQTPAVNAWIQFPCIFPSYSTQYMKKNPNTLNTIHNSTQHIKVKQTNKKNPKLYDSNDF